jgi:hypothetical protein
MILQHSDPTATRLVACIKAGDVASLGEQLAQRPELAAARIIDDRGVSRTLLHVVSDWPGHLRNVAALGATLAAAGADLNARVQHREAQGAPETPLHWAASCGDVAVLDALLDAGADIEAPGAIFTDGPAISDAVVFAQWSAAQRLLERGASTTIWQAAALGALDRVQSLRAATPSPTLHELTNALWHACRGGHQAVAEYLIECGADCNWIGHDHKTPLDAAYDADNAVLVLWLQSLGALRATGST